MSSPTHAQDSLQLTSEAGLASMGRSFAWVEAFFSTSAVPGQQAMVKTRFACCRLKLAEVRNHPTISHILVPLNVWATANLPEPEEGNAKDFVAGPVGFNCLDPRLGEFAVALAAPFMVYYIIVYYTSSHLFCQTSWHELVQIHS